LGGLVPGEATQLAGPTEVVGDDLVEVRRSLTGRGLSAGVVRCASAFACHELIRRLIAERRIRFTKLGRHVRLDREDLDAFVAAGRLEPDGSTVR